MTEMSDSDDTTVAGEERPRHRVLTDFVTDLYDCSSTPTLEVAVPDAEEPTDKEIEKCAVRPKSDMDAEKVAENEIESDADCLKCDGEAAAVDEDATNKQEKNKNDGAAEAKRYLKTTR